MNAALRDYRAIWHVATMQRAPAVMHGVTRTLAMALATVCALFVALMATVDPMDALRFCLGIPALALALAWTFLFVPGSIRLNSPANARLLPRQRRRLMQMTAACWLLATAGIAFGTGSWFALPAVALFLVALPLLSAGNKYVTLPLIIGGNWPWLARVALPPAWGDAATGAACAGLLALLVLPAAAWGLLWLYPAGGDAYVDRRDAQLRRVGQIDRCGTEPQAEPAGMAWQGGLAFYRVALRCDLAGARRRTDPGAALLHALGPAAHWTAWIGGGVTLLLVGAAVRLAPGGPHGAALHAVVDRMVWVMPLMLALPVAFGTAQYSQQLRRTRGEQALLRLTPLAGDAALLNRRLGTRLLRQALACWAATTAVALAVLALVGVGPDALWRELGLCSLAGQAAMMGLLGDHAAGEGGWTLMRGLRAGALALLQALVAVGLGRVTGTTAWPWLIVLPLAVCAVLLRRDWLRMLAAPPAFPAGRMLP